jgi:pimeloyl-ACP methyl ester carboxylesterase
MLTLTVPSSDDVHLHVVTSAAGADAAPAKPLILFVHGYPDTHRTWHPQMTAMGGDYRVAAFDLRGAGASTAPGDRKGYAIERVLPDLTAVIGAIARPGERVHLVAHDWGALISWRYVSEPVLAGRIASYTAMAGPHPDLAMALMRQRLRSGSPHEWGELLHQLRLSWYVALFQLPGIPEWRWRQAWQRLWIGIHRQGGVPADDPLLQASRDEVLAAALQPLNYYRMLGRHWGNGTLRLPPKPIGVPVSLIIPDRDLALSPRLYDNVPDHVPDLEVHHLDANHWVHHSHAAQVNELLRTFIGRHAATPAAG